MTMAPVTERLRLRTMEEGDFDALRMVLGDEDNMRYYPRAFDDAGVRDWIRRNRERCRVFGFGLWAVCLKETGALIGDCGVTMQNINGFIRPEIGWHIRRDMQRRGYAREAAAAVLDWTFSNTPFQIIYCYMKFDNLPSARTALSLGMAQTEEYPDDVNGVTRVFALSRGEWTAKKE